MNKLLILLFSILISFNSYSCNDGQSDNSISCNSFWYDFERELYDTRTAIRDGFHYLEVKKDKGSSNKSYYYDCKRISKNQYLIIKQDKWESDKNRMKGLNSEQMRVMKKTIRDEVTTAKQNCPHDTIKDFRHQITAAQLLEEDGGKIGEERRIAEEAKRIAEEKRITEEKRIAEEKKAEEKRQRVLSLKDYPGFRDLKPGLHYEEVLEICPLQKVKWGQIDDEGKSSNWVKCYGIDNIKFKAYYSDNDLLEWLSLDMGPIVNTEGFLSVFGENDSNIFIKMRKTMDKNYSRDYGYSERDRQLFNESEKSRLYEVYSGGKVVLEINRKEKDWSSDLWLYIHYFESSKAERFLKENRPVRASDDDF